MSFKPWILTSFGLITAATAWAGEAFETCPEEAFLFQSTPVQAYGVNLLTGQNSVLQTDAGMPGNINGVGFSFDDRYLYGFNMTTFEVVQIDRDFKAQPLAVTGLPANTNFFVGDVSDSVYWVYRKGVGLYRINLDPARPDYLTAIRIANADTSLNLTDFAFHPTDSQLYAVDNQQGGLYRINTETGQFTLLGMTGVTGTFGASYFDVDGFYYLSRNQDGYIFRLDLSNPASPDPTAVFFAYGPSSNQNDGARCAFAGISRSFVDWGDAPNSYGTLLNSNGARHGISPDLYLGAQAPDDEFDGQPAPDSDDSQWQDDEDGLTWSDAWRAGMYTDVTLTVVGQGFVNAWVDWNRDGQFDAATEQLWRALSLPSGTHRLPVYVPQNAQAGETWLRLRLSAQPDIGPLGGAAVGEVEDYAVTLISEPLSFRYFPGKTSWATLAFEDTWPQVGDYDLNDVVLHYRLTEVSANNEVRRIEIATQINALGAEYRSGFGVRLAGLLAEQVDSNRIVRGLNQRLNFYPQAVRADSELVIDLSADLWQDADLPCTYFRTKANCDIPQQPELSVSVSFVDGVTVEQLPAFPYDPFIFGATSQWRGVPLIDIEKQSVEIHLADHAPTNVGILGLWQAIDDDSQPLIDRYYRTETHLPWALLMNASWRHPREGVSILQAYPKFQAWVESSGSEFPDWYFDTHANTNQLY